MRKIAINPPSAEGVLFNKMAGTPMILWLSTIPFKTDLAVAAKIRSRRNDRSNNGQPPKTKPKLNHLKG